MEVRKGFYDLSVPVTANSLTETLEELYEYGYRTVAVEDVFDYTRAKAKSRAATAFPEPTDLTKLRDFYKNRLQILNRITIIFDDASIAHDMKNSQHLKLYHVIAGAPTTDAAMQYCCTTFVGDLISMNTDESKALMISHKFYTMAARRGIFFELKYAPAIRDSNQRKDIITVGQNFVANRKGNCIVISSGALDRFQVRSPYDIANLGLIFGLTEEQAKSSISHICRKVLLKADGRRHGKTVIFGKNIKGKPVSDDSDTSDEESDSGDNDEEELDTTLEDADDEMGENPAKRAKITLEEKSHLYK